MAQSKVRVKFVANAFLRRKETYYKVGEEVSFSEKQATRLIDAGLAEKIKPQRKEVPEHLEEKLEDG